METFGFIFFEIFFEHKNKGVVGGYNRLVLKFFEKEGFYASNHS